MIEPVEWNSGFDKLVGPYEVSDNKDGNIIISLDLKAKHMNPLGITHGGVLLTLIDDIMGVTAMQSINSTPAVTIEISTQFLGSSKIGDTLLACATVTKSTTHLVFVTGEIRVKKKIIFTGSGIWKIIRPR